MVIDLSGGATATKYPVRYTTQAPAHVRGAANEPCQTTELWMRRIVAPDEAFTANSYTVPVDSSKDTFWAKLTKDYYIGVFELTQKQYQLVMGDWPNSWFTNEQYRASRPLEGLQYKTFTGTWSDSQAEPSTITAASFLGKIRARTGLPINLPSSTQLGFAHRGGSQLSSSSDFQRYYINGSQAVLDDIARYDGTAEINAGSVERDCNANSGTAYVGSYLPNEYGIYDALGNVNEFTCEYAINSSTTTYRAYYQSLFSDDTLGNTKANPVIDPPGPSRDYRLNNNDVYRRGRGGQWSLGYGYQTLWRQGNVDSSAQDGSKSLREYGFRLALTVE
jgi:formylglycine-generating enzyme required for sulfatase activity